MGAGAGLETGLVGGREVGLEVGVGAGPTAEVEPGAGPAVGSVDAPVEEDGAVSDEGEPVAPVGSTESVPDGAPGSSGPPLLHPAKVTATRRAVADHHIPYPRGIILYNV